MTVWCGLAEDRPTARALLASAMEGVYQQPFERFERYSPFGTPEQVAAFLFPYVEAGCRDMNLLARGPDPEATIAAVGEVKRLLRAGVAA
jgi:hypothetical protein